MSQLGLFRRQAEAAVRNGAARAESAVRRETSITGEAGRLTAGAVRRGEQAARRGWKRHRAGSGFGRPGETVEGRTRSAPLVTADGYRRRSPVQPVYEEPGYRRRLLLRAVGAAAAVALLAFAVYYLLHSGLLAR